VYIGERDGVGVGVGESDAVEVGTGERDGVGVDVRISDDCTLPPQAATTATIPAKNISNNDLAVNSNDPQKDPCLIFGNSTADLIHRPVLGRAPYQQMMAGWFQRHGADQGFADLGA